MEEKGGVILLWSRPPQDRPSRDPTVIIKIKSLLVEFA